MKRYTPAELGDMTARTLSHYDANAASFWKGTRDHDVTQNYEALLRAIEGAPPFTILDFGCGPGRDLAWFKAQGHEPVGLEGAASFVEMARERTGCEVLQQDFLQLDLPRERFHGVFANASLFHVPKSELARVLGDLRASLRPRGVLFASNPRGDDEEGWNGPRFGSFHTWEKWRELVVAAGLEEIEHYYRPKGKLLAEQPWLASVWRKT